MYSKTEILNNLNNLNNKTVNIEVIKETSSTNDYIKKYSHTKNAIVLAKKQTSGRGRLNRTFYSPENTGIYMSVLVKPDLKSTESVKITTLTATVVAKAIEDLINAPVQIKWVNDIYINGKKVCGILAESSHNLKTGKLDYAVIGIGINVLKNSFPKEIENIATSIEEASGKKVDANILIAKIVQGLLNINDLLKTNYLQEYKNRLFILGNIVTVDTGNEKYLAKALDVLSSGALLIEVDGTTKTLNFGDVSIKI
ncbi:MAG: biotin--[acetyl-CoA-carboxylase] ligase [Clostridia bacterium]|nr:biotin--[acetyl-CoA-carboxylase] ligase [Clostridia bacterium]